MSKQQSSVPLMCPICRTPLYLFERTWQCDTNHSFDIAKQGYVNLHVVQHKHSKTPGDTTVSVTARREFLSAGFYAPLQQTMTQLIKKYHIQSVLDIGCGEGYYTHAMQQHAEHVIGLDIAKTAVQRAAKLNSNVTWVVGTGTILPVLSAQIDLCTSLFSPLPLSEIQRVLTANGYMLIVTPAEDHLYAMRDALFDQVNLHDPSKFSTQFSEHFDLIEQEKLTYPMTLSQADLKHLIAMTPYAYKAKLEKRVQLEQQQAFVVNASFQIYLFKKKAV